MGYIIGGLSIVALALILSIVALALILRPHDIGTE
jgi:hypothetical protein